jgi:hypothetical protein
MKKQIKIIFGIIFLISFSYTVYSIIGHSAEQIFPGRFVGNYTFEGNVNVTGALYGGVPPGAIMFFNLTSCPTGWSELTDATGRYIIGLNSSNPSDLGAVVGISLSNKENRTVGLHSHLVDPPSTSSDYAGSHSHGTNGATGFRYTGGATCGWGCVSTGWNHEGIGTDTAGNHYHTTDIAQFSASNAGTVSGTNSPYVQFLACVKT